MSYNTIKLMKYVDIVKEFTANATITPGMLVERMSTGKVRAHNTSQGNAQPMFALEDELQGNDINDNYSADDKVQVWVPQRGEEVFAILADGEDVSIGDFLASNGDGYLKKHEAEKGSWESDDTGSVTTYPNAIVAQALEAKDLSDSSGAEESSATVGYNKRIQVEIV